VAYPRRTPLVCWRRFRRIGTAVNDRRDLAAALPESVFPRPWITIGKLPCPG
jgi:hypothetical protein